MSQKKQNYEFNKRVHNAPPAVKKVDTDEILSGEDKIMYLLSQHWKKIAIGLAALVVVILALIIINFVNEENDKALRKEFAAAKTVEELQTIVSENADHISAIPALFRLGDLYLADKKYEQAAETYAKIYDARGNANDFDRLRAGIAAAYMLENAGKEKEAITYFEKVSSDSAALSYPALFQEAVCNAARLHLKNKDQAAALKQLNKPVLLDQADEGYWQQQHKKLKAQLGTAK